MKVMHAEIGETATFGKTVGETDVYMFAGVTGDFSGNHVDDAFMQTSKYGQRIAHGALLVGYMSTASTVIIERSLAREIDCTPVSLGYDRVRFLAPVFFGDSIKVTYTIAEVDEERRRSRAKVEIHNQKRELVAVGEHIIAWVQREHASEQASA